MSKYFWAFDESVSFFKRVICDCKCIRNIQIQREFSWPRAPVAIAVSESRCLPLWLGVGFPCFFVLLLEYHGLIVRGVEEVFAFGAWWQLIPSWRRWNKRDKFLGSLLLYQLSAKYRGYCTYVQTTMAYSKGFWSKRYGKPRAGSTVDATDAIA